MSIKNIILVASGKGGVGKSTISKEISLALQKSGSQVGLLDADIHGPNIPNLFNLKGVQPETRDNKIIPIEIAGIKIMSVGFLTDETAPLMWRGPILSKTLQELINTTEWGDLDYLIIDLPPGSGDIHITLAQRFPITGVLLVSTPNHLAISDLHRTVKMFEALSIPIIGLVENMSYLLCDSCDKKHFIFRSPNVDTLYSNMTVKILAHLPIVKSTDDAEFSAMIADVSVVVKDFRSPKEIAKG